MSPTGRDVGRWIKCAVGLLKIGLSSGTSLGRQARDNEAADRLGPWLVECEALKEVEPTVLNEENEPSAVSDAFEGCPHAA